METVQEMATRDKQINFRVSEDEADRFERVAAHFNLSLAGMLRMLVKAKDDEIAAKKTLREGQDDFTFKDHHTHVLRAIGSDPDGSSMDSKEIWEALNEVCHRHTEAPPDLGRALNQLTRNGYIKRLRGGRYVLADRGKVIAK